MQLICLCIVNIIFIFSGIASNVFVVASIRTSSQMQKKSYNFMILVLSCFDLMAVVTNHPALLLYMAVWLDKNNDTLLKFRIYLHLSSTFSGFSFLALLLMNIERYLAVYYPIFHRLSVTRKKMLSFLAILIILQTVLVISSARNVLVSKRLAAIIFSCIVFPPFFFINYKLFKMSRKMHKHDKILPENRRKIDLKGVSTCLLAVACCIVLFIPSCVYVVFGLLYKPSSDNIRLAHVWSATIYTMNSTFNSLIFFGKIEFYAYKE